jgi:4-diphosphocytidyl-2-C-methyl-D-erythritol kinase
MIVKPPLNIPTAQAFARLKPRTPELDLREILETKSVGTWKDFLRNDFEAPLFAEFPILAQVKERLYSQGAQYAALSGSGAALFGIFDGQVDIEDQFPGMTCWSGFLD